MNIYIYHAQGTAAANQTWEVSGEVECAADRMLDSVSRDMFLKLTQGKAVFSSPSTASPGPYSITQLRIEQRQP